MNPNIQQQLKALRIVYAGITIGVLVFLFVSVYINQLSGGFIKNDEMMMNTFLIVSNVISLVSITAGVLLFNKRISEPMSHDLAEKLTKYKDAMIIRGATIEGSSFIFIVCFMLFGSKLFLTEAVITFVILVFFFPTNRKIADELKIDISTLE